MLVFVFALASGGDENGRRVHRQSVDDAVFCRDRGPLPVGSAGNGVMGAWRAS